MKNDLTKLWKEIESLNNHVLLRKIIFDDIKSKKCRYEPLAKDDPYKLFELLGGDIQTIQFQSWVKGLKNYENLIKNGIKVDDDHFSFCINYHYMFTEPNNIELSFQFVVFQHFQYAITNTPYKTNGLYSNQIMREFEPYASLFL